MRKLATLCLVLALALLSAVPNAQQYTLVNLTAGSPYNQTCPNSINSQGHVTGYGFITATGEYHAFIYTNGVFKDLGLLGYTSSDGIRINDSDQVGVDGIGPGSTALFYANGQANPIGSIDGGFTYVWGMNNLGDIVGVGQNGDGANVGFSYVSGVFTDLSTVGILRAAAINDSQAIAGASGYTWTYGGYLHQVLHACLYANGVLTDLGNLASNPRTNTAAYGINNAGDIVGYSTGTDGLFHAFLYTNGTMQDLGTFNGTNTVAVGINNSGQIIGEQTDSYGILTNGPSFLYQNGTMTDLSTLIVSGGAGWSGLTATAINDNGEIVGYGTYNGNTQGFLLLPPGSAPPILTSLSPANTLAGGPAFTLTIKGGNFANAATVNWNSTALTTTYVSSNQLKAQVPASLITQPGKVKVSVVNPGGLVSTTKTFSILLTTLKLTAATLTRDSTTGTITANITLKNIGYNTAPSVSLTKAALGMAGTTTTLPVGMGSVAAAATTGTSLVFPGSAGTSGQVVALKVSGKFTGGTFSGSLKVKLP